MKQSCQLQNRQFSNFISLPDDKILDWSKLEAFTDNKMNVNEKFKFGLGRVENLVGKCWLPAISFFPTMFSKALCFRAVKSWYRVKVILGKKIPYKHFFLQGPNFAVLC